MMASNSQNDDRAGEQHPPLCSMPIEITFRGGTFPVYFPDHIGEDHARKAVASEPFQTWIKRCEKPSLDGKHFELRSIELQSVDMFGHRGVGFVKLKSNVTLYDGKSMQKAQLPGIVFLRGSAVAILTVLFCHDDNRQYGILVEQPRVPIGQVSHLELPAGMLDDTHSSIAGTAVKEMEEECGIRVDPAELVDLTELACSEAVKNGHLPVPAIAPSPGGCDELCRLFYLERSVTAQELEDMQGRLKGLREHGEYITLRVVPFEQLWKISGDVKAMVSLFLIEKLREEGRLPAAGKLAKPIKLPELCITLSSGLMAPQMAFGLYKVPYGDEGERIIADAIKVGYRHFDTASFYDNEGTLGRALRNSGIPREEFFVASKVWNDAVKDGPRAVRKSIEASLQKLNFGSYFDLFLVHWPVPNHFVDAYRVLEDMHDEGVLKSIGISNFNIAEYETLIKSKIRVAPAVNQMEVSPVMYRDDLVKYFQQKNIAVGAFKALNRAAAFEQEVISMTAEKYSVTPAQVMLRWALQKGLIVVAKSANKERMRSNRAITHFELSPDDMSALDAITSEDAIRERTELEQTRKTQL